jgi:hypothetical protein
VTIIASLLQNTEYRSPISTLASSCEGFLFLYPRLMKGLLMDVVTIRKAIERI